MGVEPINKHVQIVCSSKGCNHQLGLRVRGLK